MFPYFLPSIFDSSFKPVIRHILWVIVLEIVLYYMLYPLNRI
jgi:hypothetical protein